MKFAISYSKQENFVPILINLLKLRREENKLLQKEISSKLFSRSFAENSVISEQNYSSFERAETIPSVYIQKQLEQIMGGKVYQLIYIEKEFYNYLIGKEIRDGKLVEIEGYNEIVSTFSNSNHRLMVLLKLKSRCEMINGKVYKKFKVVDTSPAIPHNLKRRKQKIKFIFQKKQIEDVKFLKLNKLIMKQKQKTAKISKILKNLELKKSLVKHGFCILYEDWQNIQDSLQIIIK